ncbi:MAG: hypothetical protein JXR83_00865 [Deltaproteobacteria bacterium]|nr:hypothetical protein [Deltaproteobacteria bacterium]
MADADPAPERPFSLSSSLLQAALMLGVLGLCLYLVRDLWPDLRYQLLRQSEIELGRAEGADFSAQLMDGDRYVRLTGIVGNRGAVVRWGRLGALWRRQLWYRQLVGSSVFLEIPASPGEAADSRLQLFSEVTVAGRGRLFRRDAKFPEIASFMQKHYGYAVPDNAVVVAVGQRPGQRYGVLVGCALLGALALVNAIALAALLRRGWRQRASAPGRCR